MFEGEVVPGKNVGPFLLGMTITDALHYIQRHSKIIPHAELLYDENNPPQADMLITLTHNGMLLRFDFPSQRLKMIEVYDVSKVKLNYYGSVFCAPDSPPTFLLVYSRFGPSYPGDFLPNSDLYQLTYPGLTLVFPIPAQHQHLYKKSNELPLELPDGQSPLAGRILVYSGPNLQQCALPPVPLLSAYAEPVLLRAGEGVAWPQRALASHAAPALELGSPLQDVVALLGPPSRIFFKHEDKMRIHAAPDENLAAKGDYFYNYFAQGMDVMFGVPQHVVKKIVLHSNFPSHPDFNHYSKCFWKIQVTRKNAVGANETAEIDSISTWDEVQKLLGPAGKPLIFSRGSNSSPFGSTLYYAYPGVIFEVMKNNYIATVTLFPKPKVA